MEPVSAITAIGALDDPARRRLYEYVAGRGEPVGREDAARATGLPSHSARFHLDRMVDAGLLEVEYRRLSGRSGPGAGRPTKLYRRAAHEVAVSVPPRHYDLVGHVLAAAVQCSLAGADLAGSLVAEAQAAGQRDGAAYDGRGTELERTSGVLTERGYEPAVADEDLVLGNCPFDRLAAEHGELVCGLNRDYVAGVVEGLGCRHTRACLDPGAGGCCVRVMTVR